MIQGAQAVLETSTDNTADVAAVRPSSLEPPELTPTSELAPGTSGGLRSAPAMLEPCSEKQQTPHEEQQTLLLGRPEQGSLEEHGPEAAPVQSGEGAVADDTYSGHPKLTETAEKELALKLASLADNVRRLAQTSAIGQELSYTDRPHVNQAWRKLFSKERSTKGRKVSWFAGVISGGILSFLSTSLHGASPWAPPLLVAFSAILITGWRFTE